MRPAWFVWCRLQQGGTPCPAVYFDTPPSQEPERAGPVILAEHAITGAILAEVNAADGDAPWRRLEQAFPPPRPQAGAAPQSESTP